MFIGAWSLFNPCVLSYRCWFPVSDSMLWDHFFGFAGFI